MLVSRRRFFKTAGFAGATVALGRLPWADLRAVEQWLNLNLSMLRTTVQSLEVQRNTIATLKSFGGAVLSAGVAQAAPQPAAAANWPYAAGQPMVATPAAPPAMPGPSPAAPSRKRRGPRAAAAAAAAALPLNPTAWWNTLQEQFTKIAATAAAEAQAAARAAAAQSAAGRGASAGEIGKGEKKEKAPPPSPPAARRRKRRSPPRR